MLPIEKICNENLMIDENIIIVHSVCILRKDDYEGYD